MQRAPSPPLHAAAARAPQVALIAGGRLHVQDGPIDLVIGADGPAALVRQAYDDAIAQFTGLLGTLCTELPVLRAAASPDLCTAQGVVARSMWNAVRPFAGDMFITPMAAVAGAGRNGALSGAARATTAAASMSRPTCAPARAGKCPTAPICAAAPDRSI